MTVNIESNHHHPGLDCYFCPEYLGKGLEESSGGKEEGMWTPDVLFPCRALLTVTFLQVWFVLPDEKSSPESAQNAPPTAPDFVPAVPTFSASAPAPVPATAPAAWASVRTVLSNNAGFFVH
jgi:hypothetical protein